MLLYAVFFGVFQLVDKLHHVKREEEKEMRKIIHHVEIVKYYSSSAHTVSETLIRLAALRTVNLVGNF